MLSISDKSFKEAKRIFNDILEPNLLFENNYFKYNIDNSESYVYDLLENIFIATDIFFFSSRSFGE